MHIAVYQSDVARMLVGHTIGLSSVRCGVVVEGVEIVVVVVVVLETILLGGLEMLVVLVVMSVLLLLTYLTCRTADTGAQGIRPRKFSTFSGLLQSLSPRRRTCSPVCP